MKIEVSCKCGAKIKVEDNNEDKCQIVVDKFLASHSYCLWAIQNCVIKNKDK
jgi:hypothetical protein